MYIYIYIYICDNYGEIILVLIPYCSSLPLPLTLFSLVSFVFSPVASLVVSLANLEGEESFDASLLGSAEQVVQEKICDDELILIKG